MRKKLTRFRADPKKVRVSVRNMGHVGWQVTVALRKPNTCFGPVVVVDLDPETAVGLALEDARDLFTRFDCEGIDVDMQWAYEHPWHEEDRAGNEYAYLDGRLYVKYPDKKEFG